MTNNPGKITRLSERCGHRAGLTNCINEDNAILHVHQGDRMNHLLNLGMMPSRWASSMIPIISSRGACDHRRATAAMVDPSAGFRTAASPPTGGARSASPGKNHTLTHRLRAAHDAVLVGIGTVLSDNPRLTVHWWKVPAAARSWIATCAASPRRTC